MTKKQSIHPKSTKATLAARSAATGKPSKARRANTGAQKSGSQAQPSTKLQTCLELLGRKTGATLDEMMAATGWQAHSVRGFLSGTVKKKLGLSVRSIKDENGMRRYLLGQRREAA